MQLGARYDASSLTVPGGSKPEPDGNQNYLPSARPGGRLPHYWRAPGRSLLDELGPGFTLLCANAPTSEGETWEQMAHSLGIPYTSAELAEAEVAEHLGARYVLVRPELHVACRGNAPPGNIGSLLDRVRGVGPLAD